jgi:hypothetical protein
MHTPVLKILAALGAVVLAAALGGCPTGDTNNDTPPEPKSAEARLESLAPSVGTLDPAFDPDAAAYTVIVDNAVQSIAFTAVPIHPEAAVSNTSVPLSLEIGVGNYFSFRVTAENGTVQYYTVNVIRDNGRDKVVSAGPYANGFITPSPLSGPVGTKITLNVSAREGYHLNPLSLKYRITGTDRDYPAALHDYTFALPAGDVTVLAEFMTTAEFHRLFIPVPGATVDVSPSDGSSSEAPFAAGKLPVMVGGFDLSATELTLDLYNEVYQWATHADRGENRYALFTGVTGNGSGSPADPLKPVTMSWQFGIIWCNAYSEYARANLGAPYADFEPPIKSQPANSLYPAFCRFCPVTPVFFARLSFFCGAAAR